MAKRIMPKPSSRFFYPWPVVLVSCIDRAGKPNIITIGAASICSSNPPTVGVALGIAQYSLTLIEETGDFGVNIPTADQLHPTDYCGSYSGRNMNKYDACGLTPRASTTITSPLVEECPVCMECQVVHRVNLGNHDWVIGEIVSVHVDDELLDERGRLRAEKTNPLLSFWGEYWTIGENLDSWHCARRHDGA